MKFVKLNINFIIKSHLAVSQDDGNKIFTLVDKTLSSKNKLILDFKNIELIETEFVNSLFGQLYNKYTPSELNYFIKIENLSFSDKILLSEKLKTIKEANNIGISRQ